MKTLLALLLVLSCLNLSAQKVVIKGRINNKQQFLPFSQVIVNDTLAKFTKRYLTDKEFNSKVYTAFKQLSNDTVYVKNVAEKATFSIVAKVTDSLYFKAIRYITQKYAVKDLLKLKEVNIVLTPEPCEEYKPCKDTVPTNFYAFVAEKISVKSVPETYYCNTVGLDERYEARYKIIKNVYGSYSKDTITFAVYDHYGTPAFSNYKYVMLFVSEYCGKLYHEKYQYFNVYLNSEGKWASPGDPYRFDGQVDNHTVKGIPMTFSSDVSFDIKKFTYPGRQPKYEEPYFKIEKDRAIPVMGTLVDDLFLVKKQGVLNARKIFK